MFKPVASQILIWQGTVGEPGNPGQNGQKGERVGHQMTLSSFFQSFNEFYDNSSFFKKDFLNHELSVCYSQR